MAIFNISGTKYKYSFDEVCLCLSVFSKALASRQLAGIDFDYFAYTFFIFYCIFKIGNIVKARAVPIAFLLYLVLSSFIAIILLNLSFGGFFKAFVPAVIILAATFTILKGKDTNRLFLLYVKFAYWSAIFGIIQYVAGYGGVHLMQQTVGRVNSVAYEPSHYAAILIPALVYCMINRKDYKKYLIVMGAALFLTFNLTGYLIFLVIFSLVTFPPAYTIISLPIGYYLVVYVLPSLNENFALRFNDTFEVLQGKNIYTAGTDLNGTTLSMFSNWEVAKDNFSKDFLFGAGMGGHEQMYYRYFQGTPFESSYFYGLNAKPAHSLSIRIVSELGFVGVVMYIIMIIKGMMIPRKSIYYAIAIGCVSHFLCKSFKLGGYIDYGTPFFFTMLIANAKFVKFLKQKARYAARKQQTANSLQPTS